MSPMSTDAPDGSADVVRFEVKRIYHAQLLSKDVEWIVKSGYSLSDLLLHLTENENLGVDEEVHLWRTTHKGSPRVFWGGPFDYEDTDDEILFTIEHWSTREAGHEVHRPFEPPTAEGVEALAEPSDD